jgi:DNA-directed RNA polymerase specialized sigma24 family protein
MTSTVRDVHNHRSPLSRYRAERLLRTGFSARRSKVIAIVRSRLRAQGVSLDRADLEACYAQAWHGLYAATLAGETVENPEAWLVLATLRRAIDEARSAFRARPGVEEDVAAADAGARAAERTAADTSVAAIAPDMAGAIDDRTRLREVFEALRSRLSPREREAASLCYLHGLSRAQAAARMGIGERRMQKLMEGPGGGVPGIAGKVGELLRTIQAGGWCEQQSSLMRAYAFGILDPDGERYALAVAHTRGCPACRAHVAALRGLAAVLPPLPLLLPFSGSATNARSAAGPRSRLARVLSRRLSTRGMLDGARALLGAARGSSSGAGGKFALLGVLALGAGSAAIALRPSPPPARVGQARLSAGAILPWTGLRPVDLSARASVAPLIGGIGGIGGSSSGRRAAHTASARRAAAAVAAAGKPAPAIAGAAPAAGIRAGGGPAREFSPERAPSKAGGVPARAAPAAAPPAPAAPAQSEFGIE